jgi:sarcosine oxidase subunit beta
MTHYSAFAIARHALTGNTRWTRAWRDPDPKPAYDVVVIGSGHGLATAYYLAREHGIRNVAVVDKGWLGGGNIGRNTTIVRSNYALDGNTQFYEWSMKLWEGLSHALNFNVMMSHRGVFNLAHTPAQYDAFARRGNWMRLNGIDAELYDRDQTLKHLPYINPRKDFRFPVYGSLCQWRGGTARHDAVAWGYARAADRLGVDIIQNCEVTGFLRDGAGAVAGVETTRGPIRAKKVGMAIAGNSTLLAEKAGIRLPIESHVLQAFVSEPVKPLVDHVVTFGAGHFYISQSDKGGLVFGGDPDGYNSYAQRGNLPTVEHVITEGKALVPAIARVKLVRQWGGVMDMSMDGTPIICKSPVEGLYINAGWCYGGFKATPASGWCFAWTIAKDAPHAFNAKFTLERFRNGTPIDEKGQGPTPGWH